MKPSTSWTIAVILAAVGVCISFADCAGGLFDSAEEEAAAQAMLERQRVENQIRLDESAARLYNQQLILAREGVVTQTAPQVPVYVWVCGTIIALAVLLAAVILASASRSNREAHTCTFQPVPDSRHISLDRERDVVMISMRGVREGRPPWVK